MFRYLKYIFWHRHEYLPTGRWTEDGTVLADFGEIKGFMWMPGHKEMIEQECSCGNRRWIDGKPDRTKKAQIVTAEGFAVFYPDILETQDEKKEE
jgi:hypothetical protein